MAKKKMRVTNQRVKVLDSVKKAHNHPTADAVFSEVKKQLPQITLATVYRNLNLLAEQGVIQRHEINNEFHYDSEACNHQHFICEKCGSIADVYSKKLDEEARKALGRKDLEVHCVNIAYKGLCGKCKKR